MKYLKNEEINKNGGNSQFSTNSTPLMEINNPSNLQNLSKEISNPQNTFKNPLNFKRGELIATGVYGKIYKCLDSNTGRLLAVKNVKV